MCISVRVCVCVYIKQRIHKICVCADAAALAWLPWPGLVSDFVPRALPSPLPLSLSLSSLLSHKLCLILPSTSLPLLLVFLFVSLPSTFATRSCASNFALGTLALFLSLSPAPLSVDCDCGSHFNALLFVFVAAAAAATAGSSASFSFYFPVSAAQIPSPVCTRFVIAFNKNSCCSLLVSPSPPHSPLLHSLPLLYVYYCVAALPPPRLIFK